MVALPLFKISESEAEITDEMCKYIKKKKDYIPKCELDNVVLAMYLNIIKYINKEKQDKLMEMIGLTEKIKGIISEIKDNARKDGERKIINKLLKNFSTDDKSDTILITKSTLLNMLQK